MLTALISALLLTTGGSPDQQAALDSARARWAQQGLHDYGYKVRRACFCATDYTRTYRVHVRADKPVGTPKQVRDLDTVPELFAFVQDAIDQDAASLDVTYADEGYPTRISVDYQAYAVDDEQGVTVSAFGEEDPTIPHGVDDSIEDGTAAVDLADARAKWKERGFDAYRFRLKRSCFCSPLHGQVRVRNGRIVRAPKGLKRYATASRLFAVIDKAIKGRVSGLEVTYGSRGFPKRIAIDHDDLAIDEELTLITSRLHPA